MMLGIAIVDRARRAQQTKADKRVLARHVGLTAPGHGPGQPLDLFGLTFSMPSRHLHLHVRQGHQHQAGLQISAQKFGTRI